jgi:PAS domain S-box-containing protein
MNIIPGIHDYESSLENIVNIEDVLNIQDLQRLQDLFADASGIASIITYPDGTPITTPSNICRLCNEIIRKTKKGLSNCHFSDSLIGRSNPTCPAVKLCLSGGKWDAGASISLGGKHIANWLIGQVRSENIDIERLLQYADEIGANREEFLEALNEVPIMSVDQLKNVSKMLQAFANELSEKAFNNLQLKIQLKEQEKIAAALLKSEERFQSLFNNAPLSYQSLDIGGYIIEVNDQWLTTFGYSRQEVIGRWFGDFLSPLFHDCFKNRFLILKAEDQIHNEFEIVHKNGNLMFIAFEGKNGYDLDGKFKQTHCILQDITQQRKAELEILEKNKQMIELNAEKDKFFSILAHDLRGPFHSFLGLTTLVAEDLPKLKMEQLINISISMKNSATNLFRLLENLLNWAKIRQGLIPFNPKFISLYQIVIDNIEIVKEPAKKKGVVIKNICPKEIMVFADSNMLQTVIRNLISNALKFTSKGGKIDISAIQLNGLDVEVSIQDSGIGMCPEMVKDLFRIGIKTSREGTEGELSTGLGLILCNEFIKKHGGNIFAESIEDEGSMFRFTLPGKELPFH